MGVKLQKHQTVIMTSDAKYLKIERKSPLILYHFVKNLTLSLTTNLNSQK